MKRKRSITIRFGPLGLSLLAAGITAVGFAAVSLADNGSGGDTGTGTGARSRCRSRHAALPGVPSRTRISAADGQKLEDPDVQDNGAPALPTRARSIRARDRRRRRAPLTRRSPEGIRALQDQAAREAPGRRHARDRHLPLRAASGCRTEPGAEPEQSVRPAVERLDLLTRLVHHKRR
jgi:hypothetical protein